MLSPTLRQLLTQLDALPQALRGVDRVDLDPSCIDRFDDGPQHRHSVPTLIACLSGVSRVMVATDSIDLSAGEVLLIAPGVWHRHETRRHHSSLLGLGVRNRCCDVVLAGADDEFWGSVPRHPASDLLAAAVAADGRERVRRTRAVLDDLRSERLEPLPAEHPAVGRMLGRLWGSLDRLAGADDLVATSGLGRSQAFAAFSAAEGLAPRRAIEAERLRLAEALASAGVAPALVAVSVGFPDVAAWQRVRRRAAVQR